MSVLLIWLVLTCLITATVSFRLHSWTQSELTDNARVSPSAAFVPIPAVNLLAPPRVRSQSQSGMRPLVANLPPNAPRVRLLNMHTPSQPSDRPSHFESMGVGLNATDQFPQRTDGFAEAWLDALSRLSLGDAANGQQPADWTRDAEDWLGPNNLPRVDWPAGTKAYHFINKGDPTVEEYSKETPVKFQGTRQSGSYKGSSRVTFTPPRPSLVGWEAYADLEHRVPKTIELLKSNELDNPSFGVVAVTLPLVIEVTQSNMVGELSSVPHDITDAGLDARKRLVVTKVGGRNALFSGIQRGDIIRAVSVPAPDESGKPWWTPKPWEPQPLDWDKVFQPEVPAIEEGMLMLDGVGIATYEAALQANLYRATMQKHLDAAMQENHRRLEDNKIVLFLIERPFKVPDEHDPDFFGGLRWPASWHSEFGGASPLPKPTTDEVSRLRERFQGRFPGQFPGPVKRIFFDFDKTISRVHVFMVLAGWEESLPPPFALTDRGQISRIHQLNAAGPFWSYSEEFGGICPTNSNVGERWTQAALGGAARIEVLRKLFTDLRAQGIVLSIITKGYVGAVRTLLAEEGLLDNFDMVMGNIGNSYGVSEYDRLEHTPSTLEGLADDKPRGRKVDFISTLMEREGLGPGQAVLVEDDPSEIASVLDPGICETVFVANQQGMMGTEFDELRSLAGLPNPNARHTRQPVINDWRRSLAARRIERVRSA